MKSSSQWSVRLSNPVCPFHASPLAVKPRSGDRNHKFPDGTGGCRSRPAVIRQSRTSKVSLGRHALFEKFYSFRAQTEKGAALVSQLSAAEIVRLVCVGRGIRCQETALPAGLIQRQSSTRGWLPGRRHILIGAAAQKQQEDKWSTPIHFPVLPESFCNASYAYYPIMSKASTSTQLHSAAYRPQPKAAARKWSGFDLESQDLQPDDQVNHSDGA